MTTHQYMWKAISPLQTRFQNLAKMSLSNEMARYELTDILERLNGTAMASQAWIILKLICTLDWWRDEASRI